MGNVVSSGENNDDLVDILRLLGYIKTKQIERVFRAVDRGDYVLASHRDGAYKDLSWKIGNVHLSAPCVYSKVMEGLSLESGLSFLNLGSGTGYLSTMAGLILGHNGTNHGIELNLDCLEYALERLEEFKQKSLALDEFDFCEPVFIHGNCLNLEQNRQYDRVYCGAACPENSAPFIRQFVKIGGILVMPYNDHLLRIERIGFDSWNTKAMLPVSFASLVMPKAEENNSLQLPLSQPLALQELCRCRIRSELRKNVWSVHPELESKNVITSGANKTSPPQRSYPYHVVPLHEGSNNPTSSDDEDDPASRTHFLLYVDAHPGEDVTTLQVVRAMAPSRTNEYTLPPPLPTASNPDHCEISDSDEDSAVTQEQATTSDPQNSGTKYRKSVLSLSDDSDEEEESLKGTPKKSRMFDDQGYLKFDDDSMQISSEYFQTTQVDDSSPIEEVARRLLGDRSSEDCDKNESTASDNSTHSLNDSSETLTDSQKKTLNTAFFLDNDDDDNDNDNDNDNDEDEDKVGKVEELDSKLMKKNKKLHLQDSSWDSVTSLNDSDDDELEDFGKHRTSEDEEAGKSNAQSNRSKKRNLGSKTSWNRELNDSDEEGTCPLMDWSTSSTNPQTKWGIPENKSSIEGSSHLQSSEANSTIPRPPRVLAHNVDINAFSYHMKDRIFQLPLPTSLRLYINYDRGL